MSLADIDSTIGSGEPKPSTASVASGRNRFRSTPRVPTRFSLNTTAAHALHKIVHEYSDASRHVRPADEDGVEDLLVTRIERFEKRDQAPLRDRVPETEIADTGDADAVERKLAQCLATVRLDGASHLQGEVDSLPAERPNRLGPAKTEIQAIVVVEVLRRFGHAPARQVVRRGDDGSAVLAEAPRRERAVSQRTAANRHIRLPRSDVNDPVAKIDVDHDVRIAAHELTKQRHDADTPVGDRSADPDAAARRTMVRDRLLDFLEIGENAAGRYEIGAPLRGRRQHARRPQQ